MKPSAVDSKYGNNLLQVIDHTSKNIYRNFYEILLTELQYCDTKIRAAKLGQIKIPDADYEHLLRAAARVVIQDCNHFSTNFEIRIPVEERVQPYIPVQIFDQRKSENFYGLSELLQTFGAQVRSAIRHTFNWTPLVYSRHKNSFAGKFSISEDDVLRIKNEVRDCYVILSSQLSGNFDVPLQLLDVTTTTDPN